MIEVRKAEEKDVDRITELLRQVLEVHAAIRPDIFVSGGTKYKKEELAALLNEEGRYSYVAVDEDGRVLGYALCELKSSRPTNVMTPMKILYVDDLCVDERARGRGVGRRLFDYVKAEAKRLSCYEITLHVWEGNDNARAFYDKMGMKPKETVMELIVGHL